jgi:hypothetical protein
VNFHIICGYVRSVILGLEVPENKNLFEAQVKFPGNFVSQTSSALSLLVGS